MVFHYQRKPFDLSLLHTSNIPDNRRGGTRSNNTLLLKGVTYKEGNLPLFTSFLEEVFSETELPGAVILESVLTLMVKEKEPQRWEHQKNPPLELLGFAGSA